MFTSPQPHEKYCALFDITQGTCDKTSFMKGKQELQKRLSCSSLLPHRSPWYGKFWLKKTSSSSVDERLEQRVAASRLPLENLSEKKNTFVFFFSLVFQDSACLPQLGFTIKQVCVCFFFCPLNSKQCNGICLACVLIVVFQLNKGAKSSWRKRGKGERRRRAAEDNGPASLAN